MPVSSDDPVFDFPSGDAAHLSFESGGEPVPVGRDELIAWVDSAFGAGDSSHPDTGIGGIGGPNASPDPGLGAGESDGDHVGYDDIGLAFDDIGAFVVPVHGLGIAPEVDLDSDAGFDDSWDTGESVEPFDSGVDASPFDFGADGDSRLGVEPGDVPDYDAFGLGGFS